MKNKTSSSMKLKRFFFVYPGRAGIGLSAIFKGHLFLMIHPSSLDPTKTAWAAMPVGMAETIDLICEVE